MTQTAYAGKQPTGESYRSYKVLSPHYDGKPYVPKDKVPKAREKPSRAAGENPEGGNHKAAYPHVENEHPDYSVRGFDDWGATPIGYAGWVRAGEDEPSYRRDHESKSITRKQGVFKPGNTRIMNSGPKFTIVDLYVSGLADKGAYGGDFNHMGTEISKVLGPVVRKYGPQAMQRLRTKIAANDERYTLDDLVLKAA